MRLNEFVFPLVVSTIFVIHQHTVDGAVKVNKHPKLVVFSFDGFRYDYLTKAYTPTLKALKASGVTTPYMIPQFTTKTFPNHQSIVTGLYAENHGIVDNAGWDPLYRLVVSGAGVADPVFWHYSNDVLPIWLVNEMGGDGRISAAQFPGGEAGYGPRHQHIRHNLFYKNKRDRPYKERMDIVVNWLTHETDPANLVFMYFDEPDTQGHWNGPNSRQVRAAVEELDEMTAYFLQKLENLGIRDEINIMIVSDHGMEEVKYYNVIELWKLVDPSITYVRCGGSPLLHIWPKEEDVEILYNTFLSKSRSDGFDVYKKNDLPARWHYTDSRRIAPIILLANPGFKFDDVRDETCQSSDTFPRGPIPRNPEVGGYHGYDNESPNMRAFFLANGPLFQKGVSIDPFQNVDLYPLMCKIMDVPIPPNNGTLEHVLPALINATKDSSLSLLDILNPANNFVVPS